MSKLRPPVGPDDHALGSETAPVTLVEYGDYECPHCGAAHPIVKRVLRRVGRDVRFVFRNFPLGEMHPHAVQAAEAAEAAGLQDEFWRMHDQLFEHQDALEREDLVGYAKELGLDSARFAARPGSRRGRGARAQRLRLRRAQRRERNAHVLHQRDALRRELGRGVARAALKAAGQTRSR